MLYTTAAGTVSGKVYRSAVKMRIDCLVRAWQLPRICGPNPASANDGPGALMHFHPDVAMDRFSLFTLLFGGLLLFTLA